MKQILLLFLTIVTLASCTKDENPGPASLEGTVWKWSDNNSKTVNIAFYDSSKGALQIVSGSIRDRQTTWHYEYPNITVEFKEGTLQKWSGTYTVEGGLVLDGNKYTKQ